MINIPETPQQSVNPIEPITVVEGDMHNYENPRKRLRLILIILVVIIVGFVGAFRLITGNWLGASAEGSHSYNPYFAECEPVIENRPVLRQGPLSDSKDASNGPCVKALQRALNDCCTSTLTEDGWLDESTSRAVENFQKFFGLTVDGIVGPQTWASLDYVSSISQKNLATSSSPFLSPQEVWDSAHAEEETSETDTEDTDSTESTDGETGSEDESSNGSNEEGEQDTPSNVETSDSDSTSTDTSGSAPEEPEQYQADPGNCITTPELNTGTNDNDCVAKMQEIVDAPVDGDYGSVTELAVSWYTEDRCLSGSENGKKWLSTYWDGVSSCADEDLDWIEDDSIGGVGGDDSEQDDTYYDEAFIEDSDITEETFEDDTGEEFSNEDIEQDGTYSDEAPTSSGHELSAKETLAKVKCGITSNATYSYAYYKRPRYVCTELNKGTNTLSNIAFCDLQHRTTSGKFTTTLNGSCTSRRTTFTPASPLSSIYNKQSPGKVK